MTDEDRRRLERLRRFARVLDSGIRIPGTRWTIGLDPIIGLLPGVGDAAGAALSGYIVVQAARGGASVAVLLRMLGNVAIEALVGAVPVAGDVFDAVWKANEKNVRLLAAYLENPLGVHRTSSRLLVGIALTGAAVVLGALGLATYLGVLLVRLVLG